MTALLEELRSMPLVVVEQLMAANIEQYRRLRERSVPAHDPEFEENCTMFLLYQKALDERGIRSSAA